MADTIADLSCDEAEALLPLVADGVLDAETDPALFAHLARCPDCQRSLATHDLIELALASAAPEQREPEETLRWRPLSWPMAMTGGLLAAAAVLLLVWLGAQDDQAQPAAMTNGTEIVDVRTDADGNPVYRVRQGNLEFEVRDLDTATDGATPFSGAMPVTNRTR